MPLRYRFVLRKKMSEPEERILKNQIKTKSFIFVHLGKNSTKSSNDTGVNDSLSRFLELFEWHKLWYKAYSGDKDCQAGVRQHVPRGRR